MDVKDSQRIVDDVASTPLNFARAKGFLDAIDQLKATGLLEAIKGGCPHLCHPDGECPYERRFDPILAKLNALLGKP